MKQSNTQERWNLHGLLFRPISMDSVEEKVLLGKFGDYKSVTLDSHKTQTKNTPNKLSLKKHTAAKNLHCAIHAPF